MFNLWILDLRAMPHQVKAHILCESSDDLSKIASVLSGELPTFYTMVHEVLSEPLNFTEIV